MNQLSFVILFKLILFVNSYDDNVINCWDNVYNSPNRHKSYTFTNGEQISFACESCFPYSIAFINKVHMQLIWEYNFNYDTTKYYAEFDNRGGSFLFTINNLEITDAGIYLIFLPGEITFFNISINVVLSDVSDADYTMVTHVQKSTTQLICPDIIIKNYTVNPPIIDTSYRYCWLFIDEKTGEQFLFRDLYKKSLTLTDENIKKKGWYACTVFTKLTITEAEIKNYLNRPIIPIIGLFKINICKLKIATRSLNKSVVVYYGLTPIRYHGTISRFKIRQKQDKFFINVWCFILEFATTFVFLIVPIDIQYLCTYAMAVLTQG